jgi:hypothetical protein
VIVEKERLIDAFNNPATRPRAGKEIYKNMCVFF